MPGSEKVRYFAASLGKVLAGQGFHCPSCGSSRGDVVSRKYLVTSLRRCQGCGLQFRAPTISEAEDARYYDSRYESGFTTEIPEDEALRKYLSVNFAGTPKDFSRYVSILGALGARRGARLLDLGCSWGYGLWQFQAAGYDVCGFEIGSERARFARERLGVRVSSRLEDLEGEFDVIFSSHVLEHVSTLAATLSFVRKRLGEHALFVAVTPNGSAAFRDRAPRQWDRLWGLKHPLFLDVEYWKRTFGRAPFLLTTKLEDLPAMNAWSDAAGQDLGPMDGWELLAVSRGWKESS